LRPGQRNGKWGRRNPNQKKGGVGQRAKARDIVSTKPIARKARAQDQRHEKGEVGVFDAFSKLEWGFFSRGAHRYGGGGANPTQVKNGGTAR